MANTHAVETDQYAAWGNSIVDSKVALNAHLNAQISTALESVNKRNKKYSCQQVTLKILNQIQGGNFKISAISSYANKSNDILKYPTTKQRIFEKNSIYGSSKITNFLANMAKTININGIYFGTDKLGHMFLFGKKYYQRYQRLINKGVSDNNAREKVIERGLLQEKTWLGYIIISVMSLADLEANYQGLKLALDFCNSGNPYLSFNGKWKMTRKLKVQRYINPAFDETFLRPIYRPIKFKKVKLAIMKYCKMIKTNPQVTTQKALYKNIFKPSLSYILVEKHLTGTKFNAIRNTQSTELQCEQL